MDQICSSYGNTVPHQPPHHPDQNSKNNLSIVKTLCFYIQNRRYEKAA
jgi:hypothetical protein